VARRGETRRNEARRGLGAWVSARNRVYNALARRCHVSRFSLSLSRPLSLSRSPFFFFFARLRLSLKLVPFPPSPSSTPTPRAVPTRSFSRRSSRRATLLIRLAGKLALQTDFPATRHTVHGFSLLHFVFAVLRPRPWSSYRSLSAVHLTSVIDRHQLYAERDESRARFCILAKIYLFISENLENFSKMLPRALS